MIHKTSNMITLHSLPCWAALGARHPPCRVPFLRRSLQECGGAAAAEEYIASCDVTALPTTQESYHTIPLYQIDHKSSLCGPTGDTKIDITL